MGATSFHSLQGPALLLAGPGTGKTEQLALRISYLIKDRKIPPDEITVISFTRAAAQNMRERISDKRKKDVYLPRKEQPQLICTMHQLGYKIVREYHKSVGYQEPPARVIEKDWPSVLLGDSAQLLGIRREEGKKAEDCRQIGNCCPDEGSARCQVCETYRNILRHCNAIDYDDQIFLACKILRELPDALESLKQRTRHLLVDEYQDINAAQYELIRLLSDGQRAGLFVVGDDDQSIYGFRGGSPHFIRNFRQDFGKDAVIEPMTVSYRCPLHVLEGAMHLVAKCDKGRLPKGQFEYKNADGAPIKIHNAPSDEKEASEVHHIIMEALPDQDVLILVPTRKFLTAITKELKKARIPFVGPPITPGDGFPLLASLKEWLEHPEDNVAFRMCVGAFLDSSSSGVPSQLARKPEKKDERASAYKEISGLWNPVLNGKAPCLWRALSARRDDGGLFANIQSAFSRLLELYGADKEPDTFLQTYATTFAPWRDISALLQEAVAWAAPALRGQDSNGETKVRIMTFEGAKGLQADVVCVIGLEKGVIPREGHDEAEEARKLFVSMTRAVHDLHLFHARKRSGATVQRDQYKGQKPDTARSPFLDLIPKQHTQPKWDPS